MTMQESSVIYPNINPDIIMNAFSETTGLTVTSHPPKRYLWTDAFAVCNFIELYQQTKKPEHLLLARKLVYQVHHTLGKNRDGSAWLSGLSEEEAEKHPTIGGLRIGKPLEERQIEEPFNSHLEWERDGQYFHYLTKWMHALNRLANVTSNAIYNQWAIELATVAYAAFTYTPAESKVRRMVWKMSTDLSRPLVDSMGQHDPLDGLITYQQLEATSKTFSENTAFYSLKKEIDEIEAICADGQWGTEDALGIGGLLTDAYKLVQLICIGEHQHNNKLEMLLQDIDYSLQAYMRHNTLSLSAENRLAFREMGLAIGLSAIHRMQADIEKYPGRFTHVERLRSNMEELLKYYPLSEYIRDFWLNVENRSASTWLDHADINNVMLATCLAPDSYLKI